MRKSLFFTSLLALGLTVGCETAEKDLTATVDEINQNPEMYSSSRVTFSGEIEQMMDNGALVVDEMPVVVPPGAEVRGGELGRGRVAQITGRLGVIGEGDLKAESFLDVDIIDGDVAFIAESVLLSKARPQQPTRQEGPTEPPVSVTVQDVITDKIFFVTTGQDKTMPVYLAEEPTPETPIEGRYRIQAGQQVTIVGALKQMPAEDNIRDDWKLLDEQERSKLVGFDYYYHARRVENVPAEDQSGANS